MSANDTQIGGSHYQTNKALHRVEHWDWCYHNGYDIFQIYISKYIHRHKKKNGLEDLYKARHALDKYIEVLEEQEKHDKFTELGERLKTASRTLVDSDVPVTTNEFLLKPEEAILTPNSDAPFSEAHFDSNLVPPAEVSAIPFASTGNLQDDNEIADQELQGKVHGREAQTC